jgi:hypothetical protein
MQCVDRSKFNEWHAKNTDAYSSRIFTYAEQWADLMEARMAKGEALEDVADPTSHEDA